MAINLVNVLYGDTNIIKLEKIQKYKLLFGNFFNSKRLTSYINNESKKQYLLSRYFIYLMCKKNRINFDQIVIPKNKKPYIKKNVLFFSISHKDNLVVLVYSKNNVSVDVEIKKSKINWKDISKNYFTKKENNQLKEAKNKINKFYELWCMRECLTKLQTKSQIVSFKIKWKGKYIFCVGTDCQKNKSTFECLKNKFISKKINLIK